MVRALRVCLGKNLDLFCCLIVLGFVASVQADPKPLTKEEQVKVDKAIDKGVAYLKRTQRVQGNWPLYIRTGYALGQTLLPAYALLESGVPADDPVIKKAAEYVRPRVLKLDQTYDVSLALLFLDRLGDTQDKKLIQSLALRLIASQHRTGGWSYSCLTLSEANEAALFKSLEKLNKHLKKEGSAVTREALRALEVPQSLGTLTIFQDPKKRSWVEQGTSNEKESSLLAKTTDNSNTQFAILGLWAAQRHGIPMEPTFRVMVERFERSQVTNGWWTYTLDHKGDPAYIKRFPSMLCVGLIGLAVGRGLKLPTPGDSQASEVDLHVLKGLAALSQDLGVAAGGSEDHLTHRGTYYLWSVERVAMLYDLSMIGDKDWYKWGAGILLSAQGPRGEWNKVLVNGKAYNAEKGVNTLVVVDTSFALLFLKHSHPLKELTAKLPLKGKKLNQGVARLLSGAPPPEPSTDTPSRSDKP